MNTLQLELTKLLGKKELSFGCVVFDNPPYNEHNWYNNWYWQIFDIYSDHYGDWGNKDGSFLIARNWQEAIERNFADIEIIWHPATLSDFHRWMNEKWIKFIQYPKEILFDTDEDEFDSSLVYDSSKELLEQSESTLQQILELISSNN